MNASTQIKQNKSVAAPLLPKLIFQITDSASTVSQYCRDPGLSRSDLSSSHLILTGGYGRRSDGSRVREHFL